MNKPTKENLTIRDSLHGGRTDLCKIYFGKKKNKKLNLKDLANNQIKICYYDIVSLYPYICNTGPYPVSKPEYIIHDFNYGLKHSNGKPYFGFIHCKILPPQNLYHPVLGTTVQNKFIFPLCQKPADEANSLNNCCHTDDERFSSYFLFFSFIFI